MRLNNYNKWKLTDSKDCSWQLGSWNEDDKKDESLSDECSSELLPDADNVGIGVIWILDLLTLLENSLSRSERAWTFFCEVSHLVWGLPEARIISLIQNTKYFLLTEQPEENIETQGKIFLSSLPGSNTN